MAAVPKEVFSTLEKKILENFKLRSKVAKLDRQEIGLYFSRDIAIFLTGVLARGISRFTVILLTTLFQLQVSICFEREISKNGDERTLETQLFLVSCPYVLLK
jgi:hypothetical protein